MKVVVFGLGKFGSQVAKILAERHITVLGVDKEEKITDEVHKNLGITTQNLDCSTEEGLEAVDLEDTDVAVVAIGENKEACTNITAFLDDKNKEKKEKENKDMKIIARAGDPAQARALEKLGATRVVRLEEDAGIHVANLIKEKEWEDRIYIGPNGSSCKIKAENKKFIGKILDELSFGKKFKIYIYRVVGKDGKEKALVPPADYKVEEGDILEILGESENIKKFKEKYAGEITT